MKKYDEKSRKYVSVEEYERTHLPKDKEFCRGKKPHDFVLVLPDFVSFDSSYQFNPEEYYRILDEQNDFEKTTQKKLEAIGITTRFGRYSRKETRLYMCAVCKKRKYEYPE